MMRNNLNVTGPEFVQTIRGHLFGKQVLLVCCGELHQEILDLTRVNSIVLEQRTWIDSIEFREEEDLFLRKDKGKDRKKFRTRHCDSLKDALKWGKGIVKKEEEEEEDGIFLIWEYDNGREEDDSGLVSLHTPQDDDDSDNESDATEDIAINSGTTKFSCGKMTMAKHELLTIVELDLDKKFP